MGNPTNNEYMMLKRLNFLRNTLNNHSTIQTTQYSREMANTIRDERILELWKSDQEKPSVYEIVQGMKQRRESEKATEKEFNSLLLQSKNKEDLTKDHLNKASIESDAKSVPDIAENAANNPKSVQWAQRPQLDFESSKIKAPKMSMTLQESINKNKFSYKKDAEFSVQPKTGHNKTREDIMRNLKDAKEDFYQDFHQEIS